MLDQKDLQAIAELMDCRLSKTEEMITEANKGVPEVESTFAKQLIRTEDNLTRKMDEIIGKLEEIGQYCRGKKLENDNMEMVL